jgi:hypothetical protein
VSEAERIAAGLSEAQRDGVVGEFLGGTYRVTRCRRALVAKGICQPGTRALTKLGLEIRAIIERESHG